ncbi:MAG: BMP family ABC transporter substrate-binding protein, partial [Ruthenibacterium sp.]
MTSDTKKWPTAMFEAGDSDADLIITGGFQQVDNMQDIASQYPDKKWISFDTALNYEENEIGNVYSMGYQVNQAGYLAGMVAAELTTSEKEGINPEKIIGFVGGMENTPIIGEFLVGYIEGAKSVDPEIKIVTSYTNSFEDSAKGKEITLAQFNSDKADVVFAVAGASGTGCIEAAANEGKYVIGVDSDQSLLYEGRTEQKSIVTSALKRVDQSIINAVGRHLDGTLPYGTYEVLGLKDDCVGIVYNDI